LWTARLRLTVCSLLLQSRFIICFRFLLFPSGDAQGKMVARLQPVTLAAMEGQFKTEQGAAIVIIGQPNTAEQKLDNPITVPRMLSFLTYRRINLRARRVAARTGWALVLLTIVSLLATLEVRPQMLDNYRSRAWGAIFPIMVAGALIAMQYFRAKGRDLAAFLSSTVYIAGMLAGAAFALYPNLLVASTDPSYSLTVSNSAAGQYGLAWWLIGIALALGYFIYLYRSFRGKVTLEGEGY